MKRLFILAIVLMAMVSTAYAADVVASWDHDGQNVDGFYIYWRAAGSGTWTYNKHIEDGTARQMTLMPEEYFEPDVEYEFVGIAHSNTLGDAEPSNIARWTRPPGDFPWAADNLPTLQFTRPNAVTPPVVTP